ncbi:ABC transporter ATP-binding protein [Halorubellus sp. JP-L1]|uniref:ABC transporter ATP-binding protein n=1 Tax=Halorubellus sp. JP-L1 TaxID=2715753 RepID=UPI00140C75D7|nr:ABC transporter ATP-binding protein [Halorubellus sp. JP-L1]
MQSSPSGDARDGRGGTDGDGDASAGRVDAVGRDGSPDESEVAVRADGLRKAFGDPDADGVLAVDDVSFAVASGEIVGVLGPNGAGKTTTIKMLLGLVTPTAGSATVAGVDVATDERAVYEHVGAMLEGARNVYWRLSVRENLRFFAAIGGADPSDVRERHDELLSTLGIAEKADVPVRELSRGQKQKVALACTLARGADVLFLDEPTLGLDVESSLSLQRELTRLAREDDVTVVLSSHDMDVVERVSDRVVILANGRVAADERVDDLVSVFATQAYRLRASNEPGLRDAVAAAGTVESWTVHDGLARFEVVVPDQDAFYDLVDAVRETGATLDSFESVDPDLEDVFVELTSDDDATAMDSDDGNDTGRERSPPEPATDGGEES